MLFNSLEFIIFFCITTVIYFIIAGKYQKYFLLISSAVFYSFTIPWHVLLLFLIIIINYYSSKSISAKSKETGKKFLILIITFNLLILFLFKYFNFLSGNLLALSRYIGWNYSLGTLELILPLGISFFTFKSIAYDIEVYRKNIPAENNIAIFALYILIYPELAAGPIDRPKILLEQLRQTYSFDYNRITSGLKLMAWGFFQKWVIADRLSVLVNGIYEHPYENNGLSFLIATFFFAVQIYCDFSAYSDIAIGAGEVLGFKFARNFNRPYFAKSVSEFWRRWHITLSSWLRDYTFLPSVYSILRKLNNKPFLGVKPENIGYVIGTLLTMFIAGIWHGAKWTFICWGSLIGVYLTVSFITKNLRKKTVRILRLKKIPVVHKVISIVITFSLVCFAWIFFRANSLNDAVFIIKNLHTGLLDYAKTILSFPLKGNFGDVLKPLYLGFNSMEFFLSVISICVLFTINFIQRKTSIRSVIISKPLLLRWIIYLSFLIILLIYGRFENRQFIYMQF